MEDEKKVEMPVAMDLFPGAGDQTKRGKVNSVWHGIHEVIIGLYGTVVSYAISFMSLATHYPKIAAIGALGTAAGVNEVYSDTPLISGAAMVAMHKVDPEFVEQMYAEPDPIENPIEDISDMVISQAADEYYKSPEFEKLKSDVQVALSNQVQQQSYELAGISEVAEEIRVNTEEQEDLIDPSVLPYDTLED